MRLPSGTRLCLLVAFAFLLITTEFPEFSRFKTARGRRPGNDLMPADASAEGNELTDETGDGQMVYLGDGEEEGDLGRRTSILVEAIFFKRHFGHHHHHRRHYGGWGHRRHFGGYRRHFGGYRRRCCWGKRR